MEAIDPYRPQWGEVGDDVANDRRRSMHHPRILALLHEQLEDRHAQPGVDDICAHS